jgi:hypothetical protein
MGFWFYDPHIVVVHQMEQERKVKEEEALVDECPVLVL